METLLNPQQKEIFKKFSEEKAFGEITEEMKNIEKDPDYLLHHERMSSNLCRLITPTDDQFESIKDFLAMPTENLIENFSDRQTLKYTHIFSVADMLATDWVYFTVTHMRRSILNLLDRVLACESNFVLRLTAEQKLMLKN